MEYRGISLTPQTFLPKSFSTSSMGDPSLYSFPLTGHMDNSKSIKTTAWSFPQLSQNFKFSMFPTRKLDTIGKFTYVVGGFVGSKSQRNEAKQDLFPLGKVISMGLENQVQRKMFNSNSSQKAGDMMHSVMSSLLMVKPGPPGSNILKGFGGEVPEKKEEEQIKLDVKTESCLNATIRLLSECSVDSSDSDFIVFDDGVACQISDDEDDWIEENDCYNDDEELNRVKEACFKWETHYGHMPETCYNAASPKRVRFELKTKVHIMRVWDFASRAARVGPWEEAARDRARFAQRIARTEEILNPVLSASHRNKIWSQLHSDGDR